MRRKDGLVADAGQIDERRERGSAGVAGETTDRGRQGKGRARPGVRDKGRSPNIQWWSNAPWAATGYGTQTAAIIPRLKDRGHKVSVSANYGVAGAIIHWEGIPVFPSGNHGYSQDVIYSHWQAWDAEHPGPTVLFTLYDVWVIDNPRVADIPVVASWVPIDTHASINPKIADYCLRSNVFPIAMSKHGRRMLELAGVDNPGYIPHSIDTDVFKPGQKFFGKSGREIIGVDDDKFLVAMTSTNKGTVPNRKAYPEQLLAFSAFARDKDDVVLYIHADQHGSTGGLNLADLIVKCGIPEEKVLFADQYAYRTGKIPAEALASIMGDADLFLMASRGEGFGIPAIEAQACGTKVILSNATAQAELVGDGWAIGGQLDWHPGQKCWWQTPSVPDIAAALEQAYEERQRHSDKAVEFAGQYSHDRVWTDHWEPTLDRLSALCLKHVVEQKTAKAS